MKNTSNQKITAFYWLLAAISCGCFLRYPLSGAAPVFGLITSLFVARNFYQSSRQSYLALFGFGVVTFLVAFPWFPETLRASFSELTVATSRLTYLILACTAAVQFLWCNFLIRGLSKIGLLNKLLLPLPLAWMVAESTTPRIAPWLLGYSQLNFLPLAQTADLIGSQFVSFLLLWWSLLLIGTLLSSRSSSKRYFYGGSLVALTIGVLLYGEMRIASFFSAANKAPELKVQMVQGDIDLEDPVRKNAFSRIERYQQVSQASPAEDIALRIWPESSVELRLPLEDAEQKPIRLLEAPGHLLFGGSGVFETKAGETRRYNAIHLLNSEGLIESRYLKQRLMPFTEYLPLAGHLPFLYSIFPDKGFLQAGREQKPLQFSHGDRTIEVAAVVCYEELWSDVFQNVSNPTSTDFLLALSNDNWFGESVALDQHHLFGSWRAIELRKFLLRSTNTGLTAIVDATGTTVVKMPKYTQGTLTHLVPSIKRKSLFSIWGMVPMYLISALCFILAFSGFLLGSKSQSPTASN